MLITVSFCVQVHGLVRDALGAGAVARLLGRRKEPPRLDVQQVRLLHSNMLPHC